MSYVVNGSGLVKSFGQHKVLNEVALQVQAGEKVVVCGPSGSGKSTLVRILMGLETFDSGRLVVHGHDLVAKTAMPEAVQLQTGMLFQHFHLFAHLTILENCTLAPRLVKGYSLSEANEWAMQWLERVNIQDQADKYPIKLSGGQQQRAAIARCLCMQPDLILFDEPTSALDPEMIQEVLDVMLDLASSGMSMVCVTHEMAFARRFADKMLFMDQGEVVLQADTEAFFTQTKQPRVLDFLSSILGNAC